MTELKTNLDGTDLRIGVVMSRFNEPVCRSLLSSCLETLKKHGVEESKITVATVPGALEIPFALQRFAQTARFDALVALGAVIRGETYHFELVSNESARAVMDIQLEWGIPITNAILTTENDEQAEVRAVEKGADAARGAIEMANFLEATNGLR